MSNWSYYLSTSSYNYHGTWNGRLIDVRHYHGRTVPFIQFDRHFPTSERNYHSYDHLCINYYHPKSPTAQYVFKDAKIEMSG